jgi:hypothetical protein
MSPETKIAVRGTSPFEHLGIIQLDEIRNNTTRKLFSEDLEEFHKLYDNFFTAVVVST